MNSAKAQNVVLISGVIAGITGVVNAGKDGHLPSAKFLIGGGIVFTVLAGLADVEPELAAPLAIGVVTTMLLGEGNGILEYLNQRGEIDTAPKKVKGTNSLGFQTNDPAYRIQPAPGPVVMPTIANLPSARSPVAIFVNGKRELAP